MRRNRSFIVGIGRKRKRRIGQRENRAAMREANAIDHGRHHCHRDGGFASLDRQPLQAEASEGGVLSP